jgi:PKD repeat protein
LIVFLVGFLPAPAIAVTHQVTIGDNFFSPSDLTIEVGDTVAWSYSGIRIHDVTADDFSWASPTSSSISFQQTFNSVEEVRYHCSVHSSPGRNINTFMNGRINVTQTTDNQLPTADFTSNCASLECEFSDQSIDSDGTITSWSWEFGDGEISEAQRPGHDYAAEGSYQVTLTVTDNDGGSDSINRNVEVSAADTEFLINRAITDAWFNPLTDGQGFTIIVWEDLKLMFLSWFTYEIERPGEEVTAIIGEPGHRWLNGLGSYEGDTAILEIYLAAGGVFDMAEPPVNDAVLLGTVTIIWTGCDAAILSYDLPDLGLVGDIPIQRIVLENVPACEAAQTPP